ncbi:class I SAM-dependent methyltransferase [Cohnella sp.]|uniref:class I SAM-dependent methyltransferase n=1 Tax=Cohnella sp. TaxID=1883426 RepID=UPI0035698CDE
MNSYRNTAQLYDLDEREIVKDDISFYMDFANKAGGEILEVACGTGRVTIPLARAGYDITGVDLSSDMLSRLRAKLEQEPIAVRKRVDLYQADMTEFQLDRLFPLLIIPFRSFQLLTEELQPEKCLNRISSHLTDEGIFIVTAFKPYAVLDESWVQPESEDWIKVVPISGTKVRRTNIKRRIDLKNQVTYPELLYYIEDSEGHEKVYIE